MASWTTSVESKTNIVHHLYNNVGLCLSQMSAM